MVILVILPPEGTITRFPSRRLTGLHFVYVYVSVYGSVYVYVCEMMMTRNTLGTSVCACRHGEEQSQ